MIPASAITIGDDGTAWWVPQGDPDMNPMSGVDHLDRPCDECGGRSVIDRIHDGQWSEPCPDCDDTGRHTFDVHVENSYPAWLYEHFRTLRVHVIDVLPIKDSYEGRGAIYMLQGDTPFIATQSGVEDITLPPAARPGMWAVRLQIHEEIVECPDCKEAVAEAIQWRDWQSLDMGVYCDRHDPTTPENVEEPK